VREPRRILCTGGAGFIGSAVVEQLLKRAPGVERVVTLDALTYAGHRENLADFENDPRHVFVHGAIGDEALVARLCDEHAIDTVLNLAAETHVDRSISAPAPFLDTNVLGTFHLLEVVRARPKIHFHQVSTDEVYGALPPEGLFTEASPYAPRSPYAASKAAADHLVRAYANTYGLSVTLSNCSNNYGPRQHPEKLIPLALARALAGESIPIYGDGRQVRDWLYVDDHAEALWLILCRGERGATYNVGGDCELENLILVRRLLDELAAQTRGDPAALHALMRFVKDRPGHDRRYAIDATRLQDELGWRPRCGLEDGLRRTVAWTLARPAGSTKS
jgi:dTDP-glucose 4,6-dehydratase